MRWVESYAICHSAWLMNGCKVRWTLEFLPFQTLGYFVKDWSQLGREKRFQKKGFQLAFAMEFFFLKKIFCELWLNFGNQKKKKKFSCLQSLFFIRKKTLCNRGHIFQWAFSDHPSIPDFSITTEYLRIYLGFAFLFISTPQVFFLFKLSFFPKGIFGDIWEYEPRWIPGPAMLLIVLYVFLWVFSKSILYDADCRFYVGNLFWSFSNFFYICFSAVPFFGFYFLLRGFLTKPFGYDAIVRDKVRYEEWMNFMVNRLRTKRGAFDTFFWKVKNSDNSNERED